MANNLEILSSASLAILQNHASSSPKRFLEQTSGVEGLEGIEYFSTKIQSKPVDLVFGAKVKGAKADGQNALIFFESLPGLTPAQAADPRLWATLCLRDYWDYARSRYPLSEAGLFGRERKNETRSKDERIAEAQQTWIRTHYFASTARIRLRDNALARLWWIAYYAQGFESHSVESIMNVLTVPNQDVLRTLVSDRPWLASSPNSATAVIELLLDDSDYSQRNSDANRINFRNFVKELDLVAGRRVLEMLSVEELKNEFAPIYEKLVKRAD